VIQRGGLSSLICAALLACAPQATLEAGERGEHRAHDEHAEGEHADEPAHGAMPRRVRLTAQVIADAGILDVPVTREPLAETFLVVGELAADPDRTAQLAARVAGTIAALEFREGDAVKEGQVLATIRAPSLSSLRSDVASLQARATSARSNLVRLEALAARSMASQQELAAARAEAAALDAESRAAGQRLTALGIGRTGGDVLFTLRASLSGVVTQRGVVVGQAVTPETTVAKIVNLDEVWFLARIFEHHVEQVHLGAAAEVQLNAHPKDRFAGEVVYLAHEVDAASRTLTARIVLKNRDARLRLGLFGTAAITIPSDASVPGAAPLVVPRSALTEIDEKPAVFVRHADDDFELHEVVLGAEAPGRVAVLHGLREGERVVTAGVHSLKSVLLRSLFADEDHH
jgi:cobalt-zinc-cadmium efflux system membrane fusion protein